jgi:vitamin B12 transporter
MLFPFDFGCRLLLAASGTLRALVDAAVAVAAGTRWRCRCPVVVVTATRIENALDEVHRARRRDRPRDDRTQRANDTAELVRFHAGLDCRAQRRTRSDHGVFIRGAESNHTLVLVDGVRINPGTIGLPALQNIPPDLIERIEVVKGPRSALWGSDAIGGVVNIVTRRGSQRGLVEKPATAITTRARPA